MCPFLRLLLGGGLCLGGLLLVAPDHDHADKGADDGGAEEQEDDGDADGPDAGEEEVLEGVVIVDKGLPCLCVSVSMNWRYRGLEEWKKRWVIVP